MTRTVGTKKVRGDKPANKKVTTTAKKTAKETSTPEVDALRLFVDTYSKF